MSNLIYLKRFIASLESFSEDDFATIRQGRCLVFNKGDFAHFEKKYKDQNRDFHSLYWFSSTFERFIENIALHMPDALKVSKMSSRYRYVITDTADGFGSKDNCILKLKRLMVLCDLQIMGKIIALERNINLRFDSLSMPYKGANRYEIYEIFNLYCSTSFPRGIVLDEEPDTRSCLSGITSTLFVSKRSMIVEQLKEELSEINTLLGDQSFNMNVIHFSDDPVYSDIDSNMLLPLDLKLDSMLCISIESEGDVCDYNDPKQIASKANQHNSVFSRIGRLFICGGPASSEKDKSPSDQNPVRQKRQILQPS